MHFTALKTISPIRDTCSGSSVTVYANDGSFVLLLIEFGVVYIKTLQLQQK